MSGLHQNQIGDLECTNCHKLTNRLYSYDLCRECTTSEIITEKRNLKLNKIHCNNCKVEYPNQRKPEYCCALVLDSLGTECGENYDFHEGDKYEANHLFVCPT